MTSIRAYTRLIFTVIILACFVLSLLLENAIFGQKVSIGLRYRRNLIKTYMWLLNMKCTYEGHPIDEAALYVSNHRMMMDPVILLRELNAYIVSKAEVAGYPVLGVGAKRAGVIFVQRDVRNSRAAIKEKIGQLLAEGISVAIYPEGTVNVKPLTAEFSKGSFDEAAKTGRPVVPVALDYEDTSVYWYENVSLAQHFLDVFGRRTIVCKVTYGTPIFSNDTEELMLKSRQQIDTMLSQMRAGWSSAAKSSSGAVKIQDTAS